MSEYLVESYLEMIDLDTNARLDAVHEYWANRPTLQHVINEMPEDVGIAVDDMSEVRLVEILPEGDIDTSRSIALALPYLNGYSPRHYIRAKTLQLLTGAHHRVWLIPNHIDNKPAYSFSHGQKQRLAEGSMLPMGEVQMKAFEHIANLGALSVTGYSQGGLTALAMAAINSPLWIERVNADEIPSKNGRTAQELQKDFFKSRGSVRHAGNDSEISALSDDMGVLRLAMDFTRFGVNSLSAEAKLLKEAMTGSAEDLVDRAIRKGVRVKIGYVAGSTVYDRDSVSVRSDGLEVVKYTGHEFRHKHASGDNVKLHGLMADQGLRRD